MKDTTKPIVRITQPCGSICDTPIGFTPLPRNDFSRSWHVATTIVGIERKNENSKADARDMPANCPAAMVDMERDVPGNTADKIWQAPIQSAWPSDMSSIFQVCTRPPAPSGPAAT